ncbi:hypothetical protein K8T06_04870 [bacterium]|nr:hypothetical protein [bacterium]
MKKRQETSFTRILSKVLFITVGISTVLAGAFLSFFAFFGVLAGGLVTGCDFVFTSYAVSVWFRPGLSGVPVLILFGMSTKLIVSGVLLFVFFRYIKLEWLHLILGITSAVIALLISAFVWVLMYRTEMAHDNAEH